MNNAKIVIGDTDKNKNKGGILLEGQPEDLIIAIIGAMQSSKIVANLIISAVGYYKMAESKGWNITNNIKIDKDDEAIKAYNEILGDKK